MMITLAISAFLFGLAGGLHCIGMCGPLIMFIPNQSGKIFTYVIYLLGKSLAYISVCVAFYFIGQGLQMYFLQQTLSIAAGLFVLCFMFISNVKRKSRNSISSFLAKLYHQAYQFFQAKSVSGLFYIVLGFINGLMPCGLIYALLAVVVLMHSVWQVITIALFFGIGTMPLLLFAAISKQYMFSWGKSSLQRITKTLTIITASLLIMRGLNLNIPFVSPYNLSLHTIQSCH